MKDSRSESRTEIISVSSPADIDTGFHAVIEASAGTGKTYTISGLVMRLVGEEGVGINQVLVVTFTEKATGELRQRIHDDMARALEAGRFQWAERYGANGPAGWKTRFRQAVENFQEARIFTIHGFCQRTLLEYAMESDSAFDLELVDDREVFERCMNRLKRRWSLYPDIREKFQESGYSAHAWDQTIKSLAGRYHPDFTLLEPEPLSEQAVREHFKRVIEIVRPAPGVGVEDQPFYTMYQGLNFNKGSRGAVLEKVITPLIECLCGYLNDDYTSPVSCISDIQKQCVQAGYKRFNDQGFLCLVPATWNKNADQSAQSILRELGEILEVLSVQRFAFLIQVIKDLYQEAMEWKESRGLMSFDDMITRLHRGLDPSHNPNAPGLVSELRRAYRFCLVDEAQDTDPVQAAIFQQIFLNDSERSGCRLLVIGDPKQAIYGFRGADVNAYLSLKAGMIEHGARIYNLPVNFRALPDLTYSLNLLFKGDHWFPDAKSAGYADISFIPSRSQDDFQAGFRKENGPLLLHDPLGGGPIQCLTMLAEEGISAMDIRRGIAGKTASAIRKLLDEPMRFVLKGSARMLCPSDICVLVRGKTELEPLAQALQRENIAFSFYRQPGLYQSDQAFHMRLLLDAAARPGDADAVTAAMLTPFFSLEPDETPAEIIESPAAGKAREILLHASDLAILRQWPAFFQLVLEETGVLARLSAAGDERAQANMVQIAWELQQAAITAGMDIHSLLCHLDSLRQGTGGLGMDSGLHMLETEHDTVQIMTMHASKGLEFPVVFLYGGFTLIPDRSRYHTWYDQVLQRRVYDLSRSDARRHMAGMEEENKRLYYVACTRAVFRLFIPRITGDLSGKINGPMIRLVGNAIDRVESDMVDASGLESVHGEGSVQGVPEHVRSESEQPQTGEDHVLHRLAQIRPEVEPPEIPDLTGRNIMLHSYSSIARGEGDAGQGPFFGALFSDQAQAAQDETYAAGPVLPDIEQPGGVPEGMRSSAMDMAGGDAKASEGAVFELPPGADTGNLLHDILENIDYGAVAAALSYDALLSPGSSTAQCILNALKRHRIRESAPAGIGASADSAKLAAARMIFNTLRSRVPGMDMELAHIPADNRRHELEFHVSIPGGGFVTGFIDLLFCVRQGGDNGRDQYYVLDWKSTTIPGGYSPEQVARAMEEHNYHLQYMLYSWAVRRWFRLCGMDDNRIAGVYYIFTRGMDPEKPGNGVYFREFSSEDAGNFEGVITQAIKSAEGRR